VALRRTDRHAVGRLAVLIMDLVNAGPRMTRSVSRGKHQIHRRPGNGGSPCRTGGGGVVAVVSRLSKWAENTTTKRGALRSQTTSPRRRACRSAAIPNEVNLSLLVGSLLPAPRPRACRTLSQRSENDSTPEPTAKFDQPTRPPRQERPTQTAENHLGCFRVKPRCRFRDSESRFWRASQTWWREHDRHRLSAVLDAPGCAICFCEAALGAALSTMSGDESCS
jgi:hypothetical protein